MTRTEFSSPVLRESYVRVLHRSGLPIYIFPKKLTACYAAFATRYGSIDNEFCAADGEPAVRVPSGIAHFLEHKLFENADGSDSFERFSACGADANAYTGYNRTAFVFNCTERFEDALEELLTFVTHPYFTDQTVEKEQGIIAEEIRSYEDNPWERAYLNLLCAMYEKHPVREDICGSVESIREITPELLYRCHGIFYNLSNMALIVCGDVTEEQVLRVADRVLPPEPVPFRAVRVIAPEPGGVRESRVSARMQVAKPIFHIGIKDPDIPASPEERLRRDAQMTLLDEVLFSRSGEFYSELFESGMLTPGFGCSYSITDTFAFHTISGESDVPDEIFARVREYLRRTAETGLDGEVFERCRRALYADEIRAYDSTDEIANRLLNFVFDDAEMFSYPNLLQSITKEELEHLLRTSFRDDLFTLSVVVPTEETEKERN